MNLLSSFVEETRMGMMFGVILFGFLCFAVFSFAVWIYSTVKGLSKKETRKETFKELGETATTPFYVAKEFATNKELKKEMHKEFKFTYIVLALVGVLFLMMFLGIEVK
jgi:hypothetical protein